MNAATRSIIGIQCSEHFTSTLANLHWLKVSERIKFKLAVLTYRCLHGAAPRYLTDDIRLLSDIPSRCVPRPSSRNELVIKPTRLSTVGDRAFSYAAPIAFGTVYTYCRHFCTVASVISSPSQDSAVPVFVSYELIVFFCFNSGPCSCFFFTIGHFKKCVMYVIGYTVGLQCVYVRLMCV